MNDNKEYSPEEYVEELNSLYSTEDARAPGIVGRIRAKEDNSTVLSFSPGNLGVRWIELPVNRIQRVRTLDTGSGDQVQTVELWLRSESDSSMEGDSYVDLVRKMSRYAQAGAEVRNCPKGMQPIGANVGLRGRHTWSLFNESTETVNVSVRIRLDDDRGNRFEDTRTFKMVGHDLKDGSASSALLAAYERPGIVRVTATTTISGGAGSDTAKSTNCSFQVYRPGSG